MNEAEIYLQIEGVLDKHRRDGVGELTIRAALQRAWGSSSALLEAGKSMGTADGERRRRVL